MRKLSAEEKENIRKDAISLYKKTKSMTATARELKINRQVLYTWFAQPKERQEYRCRPFHEQAEKLMNVLYYNSPKDFGLKESYWTLRMIHWVYVNKLKANDSLYYIKKILHRYGFLKPAQIKKPFNECYPESDGYSAVEYTRNKNYRCFFITVIQVHFHLFLCEYSPRGDFRMISCPFHSRVGFYKKWIHRKRVDTLISNLIRKSKNKILVIHAIKGYKPKQDFKEKCLLIERKE